MTKKQESTVSRGLPIYLAVWVTGFVMVFFVPWYVGDPPKAAGQSYEYGFNNRFAVLSLAAMLLLLTACRIWVLARTSQNDYLECLSRTPKIFPPFSRARGEYLVLFVVTAVAVGVHLLWNSLLILPYWGGELAYFLGRLDLLQLGLRPHVDFQFNYGPALLYLPFWTAHLSFGLLGIEDAYAVFLAASFGAGFLFVFVFLRSLNLPANWRPWVLLLALLMWMFLTMGLNYSPLRFTMVPAALTLFHLWLSRERGVAGFGWREALVAAVCASACFLLSPEMGFACLAGLLGYAGILILRGKTMLASGIILGGGASLLIIGLTCPGYFWSIGAFSSGGYNFPIFPNTTNLLLFFCAAFIVPGLLFSSLTRLDDSRAPFAVSLAGAATMLLPAAFGRCDPGHIAVNGYTTFMLCFAVAANYSPLTFRLWTGVFAVVFVVLANMSYWSHYEGLLRQAVQIRSAVAAQPELLSDWRAAWSWINSQANLRQYSWRKVVPSPPVLEGVTEGEKVGIPFEVDTSVERLLKKQPGFKAVYFQPPIMNALSPQDVDRAFEDCMRLDLILVPESTVAAASAEIDLRQYEEGTRKFVSGLMLFPVVVPLKNGPYRPEVDLVQRLINACDIEPFSVQGLLALRPRS
jgi:hypothetical protein